MGSVYVLGVDESLNAVVQKSQMDITVRYWHMGRTRTQYLCSYFLGHATADDLLDSFAKVFEHLCPTKLLQVSMDGPNVNHSFFEKLIRI